MTARRTRPNVDPQVLWIACALLLAGIIGASLWIMHIQPPSENSPDVTFARDMSAHHDQAVEMAITLRDRTADEELRSFALDIMLTQQAQIGQMNGWLSVWGRPLTGSTAPMAGHGDMMGMASQADLTRLQTLPQAEAEVLFLQLMIRHHQGGVIMAQIALAEADQPVTTQLATRIIQGQQSEITYMESLLQKRGAALPEPVTPMPGMDENHGPDH